MIRIGQSTSNPGHIFIDGDWGAPVIAASISRSSAEQLRDALTAYLDRPPVKLWIVRHGEAKPTNTEIFVGQRIDHVSSIFPVEGQIWARTAEGARRRFEELSGHLRTREQAEAYDD